MTETGSTAAITTEDRLHQSAPSCRDCANLAPAPQGSPIVALVGAPNSGKSTLFNALTGARVKIGNWPGTSVEVSRGAWKPSGQNTTYDIIDFPGAYSLDPMSPDEALTREMLVHRPENERPDVVVAIVDASALARSLYLALQVAEQGYRMVLALTKNDVATAQGAPVDPEQLAASMSLPVVEVNGRRRVGVDKLTAALQSAQPSTHRDEGEDARFARIDAALSQAVSSGERKTTWSERIDSVALHPVAGPLLFLAVMWLVFQITTTVAAPLQDGLEAIITGPVSDWARGALESVGLNNRFFEGLLVDGLLGGVGMVLTFAPLMALMFLCLAVLEDSGYMARAAVATDRVMRALGLPGKAFIPIVVGFGCNVPAISATRVLGSPRHRILTSLLIPFTSCSARLVVFLMLATVFFPENAGSAVFAMYVLSILLVVITGLALRHTLWRAMPAEPLLIDLPTYQLPTARLAASVTWARLKGFLETAGKIIVATVVVVWLLMSIPVSGGHELAEDGLPPQDSAYGAVSRTIAPAFKPAGYDSWSLAGPLITGFVAKEAVISTWAQTYAVDDVTDADPGEQAQSDLAQHIRADFSRASGGHTLAAVWAYMVFMLAYTPCVATIAAQRREVGWKWTLFGFAVQFTTAWLISIATFQLLKVFL